MVGRVLMLYRIALAEFWHRLRYDLGREVTVLLSSSILFATFFYIFNDFLNVQISSLSQLMRDKFAGFAAVLLAAVAAAWPARLIRAELWGERSLRVTAASLGEQLGVVRAFLFLRHATLIICVHAVAWWVIQRYLIPVSGQQICLWEAVLLIFSLGLCLWRPRSSATEKVPVAGPWRDRSVPMTMVLWRAKEMFGRNRLTRLCLVMAGIFALLLFLAAYRGAPLFVAVAIGMAMGYLAAASLCFQVAEDLQHAWIERALGVSHAQFLATYEWLGGAVGGASGLVAGLVYLLGLVLGHGIPASALLDAAKVMVVTALPAVLAPLLLLQIDGRRPAINLLLVLIIGLFIGTAVFAHWLGLLLIPLFWHYAAKHQDGRFYRA